jgi:CHRD domain-containing protein
MRRRRVLLAVAVLAVGLLVASLAVAAGGKKNLKADQLTGYQENPDISSVATGSFKATLDDDAQTITYELTYSGLEGTVTQAHIHFGKRAVNGGITVFLCGTAASPGPPGTPTCPAEGTVSRTVTAADILAPATATGPQGIEAGNYEELAAAMRAGHTYANVHSSLWPGGEIRAQINDRDANN